MATLPQPERRYNVELAVFLSITIVATWLLQGIGIWRLGPGMLASPIPLCSMFIPAAAAIICMFLFRPVAVAWPVKAFFAFFLVSAALAAVEMVFGPLLGAAGGYPVLSVSVATAGFLALVALNMRRPWRRKLEDAGLSVGRNLRWYLLLLAFAALYIAGMALSYYLGLSSPSVEFSPAGFFSAAGVAFAGLVFSWPAYFGEEYGWRYYLQERLFSLMGGYRGVAVLGAIWGLWHLPAMLIGLNFPGDPAVPANAAYLVYTIAMSVVFGYAVLKTRSVLIAVVLHAITDITVNAGRNFIATSNSIVSFLPLLGLMVLFAAVLLKSRVWRVPEAGAAPGAGVGP